MYIKIYTESQLVLLRNINSLLGKYKIPKEILKEVGKMLTVEKLGKCGFIAIFLNPLIDSVEEIKETLNLYPQRIEVVKDLKDIEVQEKKSWMSKRKEWYLDEWKVNNDRSKIYVIYSVKLKRYYDLK